MVDIAVLEGKLKELKIKREALWNGRYTLQAAGGDYGVYQHWCGLNYSVVILSDLIDEIKDGRGY